MLKVLIAVFGAQVGVLLVYLGHNFHIAAWSLSGAKFMFQAPQALQRQPC